MGVLTVINEQQPSTKLSTITEYCCVWPEVLCNHGGISFNNRLYLCTST